MAIERERKFFVIKEKLPGFAGSHTIIQAYLPSAKTLSLRVRIMDDRAFLTLKGPDDNGVRSEFEFGISLEEAKELMNSFESFTITKIRHIIFYSGYKWEIDEFLGENAGLWLAEVEYNSEGEEIPLPEWVAKEVTGIEKYHNSSLARYPFSKIKNDHD